MTCTMLLRILGPCRMPLQMIESDPNSIIRLQLRQHLKRLNCLPGQCLKIAHI